MTNRNKCAKQIKPYWLEMCRALAENNMILSQAARELGMPRNTFRAHCVEIALGTGLNPLNFYDLNELLYMEVEKHD